MTVVLVSLVVICASTDVTTPRPSVQGDELHQKTEDQPATTSINLRGDSPLPTRTNHDNENDVVGVIVENATTNRTLSLTSASIVAESEVASGRTSDVSDESLVSAADDVERDDDAATARSEDRVSLVLDDAVRASQGPVAFWLKYEASAADLQRLVDAQLVQHHLDTVSSDLAERKRQIQHQHHVDTLHVANRRDSHLDTLPHYWSRKWSTEAASFWQHPYWSPKEVQAQHHRSPSAVTTKTGVVAYLAVDDEIFLKQGLTHLRCTYHRDVNAETADAAAGDHHHHSGTLLTLAFLFSDVPNMVYPFVERQILWSLPVSTAQRFSTFEHSMSSFSANSDDLGASAGEERHLGNGTRIHFRQEVVDDVLKQLLDEQHSELDGGSPVPTPQVVYPNPRSFFYLFASAEEHARLPRSDWVRLQSRFGSLVRDVCDVTCRFNAHDDGYTVSRAPSKAETSEVSKDHDTQRDTHDDAYDRWLQEMANDAAVFAQSDEL